MIKKEWPLALQLISVGVCVTASLIVPTAMGFFLDSRSAQGFPFYTLGGLALGTVVMIFGVYRVQGRFITDKTDC